MACGTPRDGVIGDGIEIEGVRRYDYEDEDTVDDVRVTYDDGSHVLWSQLAKGYTTTSGHRQDVIALRVYRYSHSGSFYFTEDYGGYVPDWQWDVSAIGYIFVTLDKVRQRFGWKNVTEKRRQQVREALNAEIETFGAWANGEVFTITVESLEWDENGDEEFDDDEQFDAAWNSLDSCSGFIDTYPYRYIYGEARQMVRGYVNECGYPAHVYLDNDWKFQIRPEESVQ
jgi:hypothetical protein